MTRNQLFYRFFVWMLIGSLVLVPGGTVLAQDELPRVICDELAEEDCLLLRRSRQAMNEVTMAHTTIQSLFQLADMPTTTVNGETVEIPALAVELDIESAYSFDERTADQLRTLAGIDQNAMAMAAMIAPESILQIFAGLTAETEMRVRLSDAVQEMLAEQSDQLFPEEITIHLRVVDNMLYINLDAIAEALNSSSPPAAWGVIDLAELWEMPTPNDEALSPATSMAFLVGMLVARSDEQLVTYYEDLQKLRVLDRQLAPGRIVQVARGEDEIIDGLTVNTFTTTVDVQRMVTWIAGLLEKMLRNLGEEPDPEITVALTMGPSLLAGVESRNTIYIEPATARLHWQESELVWDFTPFVSMAGMLASQSGTDLQMEREPGTTPQLVLRTVTDYDYATPVIVDVPEDLVEVPLDEVFGQ